MAEIFPFRAYRYSSQAGSLQDLATQPYDKITPVMQARYLETSPHNLVRIILGERFPGDTDSENVYTRAARYLNDWIAEGVLAQEPEPCLFAYFQEFGVPDSSERVVRKGFIALGKLEDYSAGVVHRHEQTLSGPKKDRMDLLRHTRAQMEQLFMLYPDPQGEIDAALDEAARAEPTASVVDEMGEWHTIWKITEPGRIEKIRALMADKKLIIADGHHRYETALNFARQNPTLPGADRTQMTFFNLHSEGLKVLATHRVLSGLPHFDPEVFFEKAATCRVRPVEDVEQLKAGLADTSSGTIPIGVATADRLALIEVPDPGGELDLVLLHRDILDGQLGVTPEDCREERYIHYVRGIENAVEHVRGGGAQIGLLVRPTTVEQVARISLAGGTMPQKSTDFYPKLLSGLTFYLFGQPPAAT